MMNCRVEVKDKPNQYHRILAAKINRSVPSAISDTSALAEALGANTSHHKIQSLTSSKACTGARPKDLMERWGIGLETDNNTIGTTTKV